MLWSYLRSHLSLGENLQNLINRLNHHSKHLQEVCLCECVPEVMPERSWIADRLGECKVCPPNRPLEVLIDSSLGTPSKPAPFPHTQWGEGRGGERIATLLRGVDERLSRFIISHIGSFVKCAISSYKPGVHLSDAFGPGRAIHLISRLISTCESS